MVLRLIKGVGIWEDEHLGVGVDGDVELNCVLVSAQEVGHSLRLGLRLRKRPAVDFLTRILRGSLNWEQQRHVTLWKLQRPLHDQRVRPHMRKKKGKENLLPQSTSKFLLRSTPTQKPDLLMERFFLHHLLLI